MPATLAKPRATEAEAPEMRRAFAQRFSIEATRPGAAEIAALASVLPPGTQVYLSAVPRMELAELVSAAAALRKAGLEPVAHLAARRIASAGQLAELLKGLTGEAAMRHLLVIGGDLEAGGPYVDALALIQRGRLRAAGIEEIGIAAYPEGHGHIPPGRLESALDEKTASAIALGLKVHIVSQFSFSPERVLAFLRQLRGCGIATPVKVGMAGPTSVPALLRYAKRCGVAASLRGLVSGLVGQIVGNVGPDRIVAQLSAADSAGDLGNIAPHYFSFGGVVETADYACEAARGTPGANRAMANHN
jgi:methylenetetrahydrofolate reductase (NADPH)